jgi:hypothetical protein
MTYYDCRFIGLENTWDNKTGIKLDTTGIAGAYRDYKGTTKNKKIDTANIATFNIKVNGKNINNSKEKYPFLTYRNVTYFPINLYYQEFSLTYKLNNNCFYIKSSNPKLEKKKFDGYVHSMICVDGYFYYGDEKFIYQLSPANSYIPKKIYELPKHSYALPEKDTYVKYSLSVRNDEAYLQYHQGGGIMGYNAHIILNKDGTYTEYNCTLGYKKYDNITIECMDFLPPGPGNLRIKYNNKIEKAIGSDSILYGWNYSDYSSICSDIYLINNNVYVVGVNLQKEKLGGIYKVNIKTNETTKLNDRCIAHFKMNNEFIYFIDNNRLYKLSLNGGKEDIIPSEEGIRYFELFNENIYYVNDSDKLYKLGSNKPINAEGKVTTFKIHDDYLIVTFKEEKINPYRMIVIDKEGKIVFKTADVTLCEYIENGKLGYIEKYSKNLYVTKLK